jgi:hypothetical protein
MDEIIFLVEDSVEGGYTAKAIGFGIFSEADTYDMLKESVKEAINCHFDDNKPRLVRLHYVKDEVFAA